MFIHWLNHPVESRLCFVHVVIVVVFLGVEVAVVDGLQRGRVRDRLQLVLEAARVVLPAPTEPHDAANYNQPNHYPDTQPDHQRP